MEKYAQPGDLVTVTNLGENYQDIGIVVKPSLSKMHLYVLIAGKDPIFDWVWWQTKPLIVYKPNVGK